MFCMVYNATRFQEKGTARAGKAREGFRKGMG